jgi:hypothetical protein
MEHSKGLSFVNSFFYIKCRRMRHLNEIVSAGYPRIKYECRECQNEWNTAERRRKGQRPQEEYFQDTRIAAIDRIRSGMKQCRKCRVLKSLDDFYTEGTEGKAGLDGKRGKCKACQKAARTTKA